MADKAFVAYAIIFVMLAKTKKIDHNHTSVLLLRSGLAIVFLYAAISSLKTPLDWVGYMPHFLTNSFTATTLVKILALYEIGLALWLISGRYLRYAALLCNLTLSGIVVLNPHDLIVTFRDIGLAFAALSLVFIDK